MGSVQADLGGGIEQVERFGPETKAAFTTNRDGGRTGRQDAQRRACLGQQDVDQLLAAQRFNQIDLGAQLGLLRRYQGDVLRANTQRHVARGNGDSGCQDDLGAFESERFRLRARREKRRGYRR